MFFLLIPLLFFYPCFAQIPISTENPSLCYWQPKQFTNFGDCLSLQLIERIVGSSVQTFHPNLHKGQKKFLAIGSILILANDNDIIWGTGMNGKRLDLKHYKFINLDIRAVRGPLTRKFILDHFNIKCPEIYGDPALLFPYFFPEFKKEPFPYYDYVIIPHYSEISLFPKSEYPNVVYPTEPWKVVISKILNSSFVIASSLHGIIIAEAYGIPAKYLRTTENEPLYKYKDYYLGTNRPNFQYASSIQDALQMGGEPPFECDLKNLYNSFPFEYWPNATFTQPDFSDLLIKKPF